MTTTTERDKLAHDEGWLSKEIDDAIERIDFSAMTQRTLGPSVRNACRQYHEHMTRWRSLTEFPEDGERVQIVCKITMRLDGEERILSHIKVFHRARGFEKGDAEYICWRPVPLGDLPDAEIISGESE